MKLVRTLDVPAINVLIPSWNLIFPSVPGVILRLRYLYVWLRGINWLFFLRKPAVQVGTRILTARCFLISRACTTIANSQLQQPIHILKYLISAIVYKALILVFHILSGTSASRELKWCPKYFSSCDLNWNLFTAWDGRTAINIVFTGFDICNLSYSPYQFGSTILSTIMASHQPLSSYVS